MEMGQEKVANAARGKLCEAEQPLAPSQTAPRCQEEEELSQERGFLVWEDALLSRMENPQAEEL